MKEKVIENYKAGQEELLNAFYDAAAADGLEEGKKIGFEEGKASVPVASEDGVYTQEEMDKYAEGKVAEAIAALPADTTPYSQEDMDLAKLELELVKEELAKVKSDDEFDKAAIAEGQSKIAAVLAILAPKAPEVPETQEPQV